MNAPCRSNVDEVLLSDEGVPVLLQRGGSRGVILELAERIFVDNLVVASSIEQRWGDPSLQGNKKQGSRQHPHKQHGVVNTGIVPQGPAILLD